MLNTNPAGNTLEFSGGSGLNGGFSSGGGLQG
jgi:hypothetical protein